MSSRSPPPPASVLSIQSHVVHGYVGNRCASFCFQRLGIEVETIHTVQFSNHTQYPHVTGTAHKGKDLTELYKGLEANDFPPHSHILTGYMGTREMLESIVHIVKRAKERNPQTVFVCDPVMGDEGKLYVPQDLVAFYRSDIVRMADVVVPNQFEAELLTEMSIKDLPSAAAACSRLHAMGPHTVVISSLEVPDGRAGCLTLFASTTTRQIAERPQQFLIHIPKIDYQFTGTGDLFSALVVALMIERPSELAWVCVQAASRLHSLIEKTFAQDPTGRTYQLELDIIRYQDLFVQAHDKFVAVPFLGSLM